MPKRPLHTFWQTAVWLLLLLALWLGGLHWFTRTIATSTPVEMAVPLDAVVVLTGGSNRLQTGFDLLEKGMGKKIFVSGVYRGVDIRELLDQWKNENREDLDCCVVLGFDADNTIGNARETAEWMAREGYHSLYLVTANYHMKRAQLAFRRSAPGLKISPWPVTPSGLDMDNWWRDAQYRSLIIREYSKYIAALVLYAITI
jgi:uncharacterized SAM-binding protein YcdF (DUF218 family)